LGPNEFLIYYDQDENFIFGGTYVINKCGDVVFTVDCNTMPATIQNSINGMYDAPTLKMSTNQISGFTVKVTQDNDVKTKNGMATIKINIQVTFKGNVMFNGTDNVCLSGTLKICGNGTEIGTPVGD